MQGEQLPLTGEQGRVFLLTSPLIGLANDIAGWSTAGWSTIRPPLCRSVQGTLRQRNAMRAILRHRPCEARALAMALPAVAVVAVPPRSGVRSALSTSVASMAFTMPAAASASPRRSSIIAADQIWAIGLAMPLPAMSGAEP